MCYLLQERDIRQPLAYASVMRNIGTVGTRIQNTQPPQIEQVWFIIKIPRAIGNRVTGSTGSVG